MSYLRHFALFTSLVAIVACGTGQPTTAPSSVQPTTPSITSQPTTPSSTSQPATGAPTTAVTTAPGASLDPSLSDAGIVGLVMLTNDTRGGRDGTHYIAGVDADGSNCSNSLGGTEFTAVAWFDDAPVGQLHFFSATVPADAVPAADGETTDISGGVSVDFVSESGFGTQYSGNASRDNDGQSTINVRRDGDALTFDFEGATWDNVSFAGQLICADAS